MPSTITLSVKNVPTAVAKRLQERAARNNRALQGERQSILHAAATLAMLSGFASVASKRVEEPATKIAALAVHTSLTAYDASYLWLAMSRDVELVTLDDELARVNQQMRER